MLLQRMQWHLFLSKNIRTVKSPGTLVLLWFSMASQFRQSCLAQYSPAIIVELICRAAHRIFELGGRDLYVCLSCRRLLFPSYLVRSQNHFCQPHFHEHGSLTNRWTIAWRSAQIASLYQFINSFNYKLNCHIPQECSVCSYVVEFSNQAGWET